jgi:nucleotide-binding universal stress UspA family protein
MSGIISAIRGGVESQLTIEKAIQLSKETHISLYFLYVVNLDFLIRTETSRTHTLAEEMHEMGEFILLQASAKAQEHNIHPKTMVRRGTVREQLIELCQQLDADYIVMGQPRSKKDTDLFTPDQLTNFGRRLEDETNAKVVFVKQDRPE